MGKPTSKRTPFQVWLRQQLHARHMTQKDLAERIGYHKASISKWFISPGNQYYRRPEYEACVAMADLFGTTVEHILELSGRDVVEPTSLSPLQREIINMIPHIPDPLLLTVQPHLQALLDQSVQTHILRAIAEYGAAYSAEIEH